MRTPTESERISMFFPKKTLAAYSALSKHTGRNRSELLRQAAHEYLQRETEKLRQARGTS